MNRREVRTRGRRLGRVAEAAAMAGLSPRTIWARIAAGEIPVYRFGCRATRVDLDEVEAWIEAARQSPLKR